MKHAFLFFFAFTWKIVSFAQVSSIMPADLKQAEGQWTGSLTYLDYSRNKEVTISSKLEVLIKKQGRELLMKFSYPDEPDYGTTEHVRISNDGLMLEDADVKEKSQLADGSLRIVTEERGKDDRKPATIRKVILLGKDKLSITKMVRFDNGTDFFRRNVYEWKRS